MLVQISNLTKNYHNHTALKNINLNLDSGKIIGLFGNNGSGKTTLLKILTGLIKNYTGEVLFEGQKINNATKSQVAYLPDTNFLPIHWNLHYACRFFSDFFDGFDTQKALSLCNTLNINPEAKIKTLSKGNQEKLVLLLTLSRKAKLYLLDEPIAGADPIVRKTIFEMILQNHHQDSTIIISTHLVAYVQSIINEVIFLQNGTITLHKNTQDLPQDLEHHFGEYCNAKTFEI